MARGRRRIGRANRALRCSPAEVGSSGLESSVAEEAGVELRSPLVVWREWLAVCGVTGLILGLWLVRGLWMAERVAGVDPADERRRVGWLDMNRATEAELVRLPGVGEGLAARIVQHRLQVGEFRTLEQLTDVAGIGPQRLQQLRAFCFVAGEVESSDRKVVPENRRTVSVAGPLSARR